MGVKCVKKSRLADENLSVRVLRVLRVSAAATHAITAGPHDPDEEGFTPEGFLRIYMYMIYKYSMRVLPYVFVHRKRFVQKYKIQTSLVDNAIPPFHFYKRITKTFHSIRLSLT